MSDNTITYLADMYEDPYFPNFLVDKVKAEIEQVAAYLEQGNTDLKHIQERLDAMTIAINALEEQFDEHDSEIETVARESIAETVGAVLQHYGIAIDVEEAIRERDW